MSTYICTYIYIHIQHIYYILDILDIICSRSNIPYLHVTGRN